MDGFHIFPFGRAGKDLLQLASSSDTSILISRLIKRMTLHSPRVSISAAGVKTSRARYAAVTGSCASRLAPAAGTDVE